MNEQQLWHMIDGAVERKPAALHRILDTYGPMVRTLVSELLNNDMDAEEVYQNVFLKVFDHIGDYKPERASFDVWVRRIAYNEAINCIRYQKRQRLIYVEDYNLEEITDTHLSTESVADDTEIELVAQALDFLAPTDKALVLMFYNDNMSLSEIAAVVGSKASSVGSRLFRIRKKLYTIINERFR